MKQLLLASCCICILMACSKKTVPSKPNYTLGNNSNKAESNPVTTTDSAMVKTSPVDSATTVAGSVMVISDGYGKLVTSQQSLPTDGSIKYNSLQLSRGFTPQQRANLQARYQTIPPRVLYVPDQNSSSSLKGSYYIYKKKFWYWKKSDGLYYLDQKYYL